jgi:hypothetical protein
MVGAVLVLKSRGRQGELDEYKTRAHKYSGIRPDVYYEFVNEIDMYTRSPSVDTALTHLYRAIDVLQELALYAHPSSDAPYFIRVLANDLGNDGEDLLMKRALARGENFTPKYLKEYPSVP